MKMEISSITNLFCVLDSTDELKQQLSKIYGADAYGSTPILETPFSYFETQENNNGNYDIELSRRDILLEDMKIPRLSKKLPFTKKEVSATCTLNRAFVSTSKITAQISFSNENSFGSFINSIHPHNIFSDIILESKIDFQPDNKILVHDHLTPYFFDVYEDCFTENKDSYKLVITSFSDGGIEMNTITLPLPFYFDRQNTNLNTIAAQKYYVRFVLSDEITEILGKNILSVKLILQASIETGWPPIYKNFPQYVEKVRPLNNINIGTKTRQSYCADGQGFCKNIFFAVIGYQNRKIRNTKIS